MMKEDRKPLRYITNGMVAMNFCWREKEKQNEQTAVMQNITDGVLGMSRIWCYLGQTQSVDEIH